ncbi:Na(+)-translocating NADH-quinone reductase subunit F [Cochleicola gelatinilyticus]|uniref:Na(+)-translocating NADH-quinone reductase subunit F n=1 Tax=Cochleicola gelatinilyticus TaxID=1763537 RepID=A0A167F372_9FLAO|nr:Na(+)-translocating NADH-quinone reductase subunit F [Cochleicola gelatinilyticus]OAB76143.1 Na(+)-translocating NADH-quinone reductase subunit F [Cochleicola gelatinilyticus]
MSTSLTPQELHNLAMNIVGEDLQENGYEFLGVNSKLEKDPQFVAIKEGNLNFVIVRAVTYPQDVKEYDEEFMQKMKDHAMKFEAKTYYAGVGLGHGTDYGKPVVKDENYTMIYNGMVEII